MSCKLFNLICVQGIINSILHKHDTDVELILKYFIEFDCSLFTVVFCDECGKEFQTKQEIHFFLLLKQHNLMLNIG